MNKFLMMVASTVWLSLGSLAQAYPGLLTGFYMGASAGALFNEAQLNSQHLGFTNPAGTCSVDSTFSSFSPGIQLGYSYPFPNHWVFGVETDLNFNTHQSVTFGCSCPDNPGVADQFPFKNQMQGAIKGRVGRALDWRSHTLLPYLTAGLGFAKVRLTYHNEGGDDYSNTTTKPGWLIGAGIESALGEHWSVRGEYNYADYDDISLAIPSVYRLNDPNGHGRVNLSSSAIELSINYWI